MNIVNQIEIQDKDGVQKALITEGDVELQGGGHMSVLVDDADDIEIAAGLVTGDDPYYRQKYEDIVAGCAAGTNTPSYGPFTGIPYWISSVNRTPGIDRHLFLLGGATSQIGVHATTNPDEWANALSVFDMGVANVDCEDYEAFYAHMEVVKDKIDEQKSNIESVPDDAAVNGYGVFDQYIALVSYWNYLVMLIGSGSSVYEDATGNTIVRFVYQNSGNPTAGSALSVDIHDDIVLPIPIVSTTHLFRPEDHTVSVTETPTAVGADYVLDADFEPNTQWITDINLGPLAPGTEVNYTGIWTNVSYDAETSGSFTVA